MDKQYDYNQNEKRTYKQWEESGAFSPPAGEKAKKTNKKPFTIIMPPANANDPLHVGHALGISLQDSLIRYHRMRGENSLWLPGTDHAGIETQYVFEKKLSKEGKSRFDFDRKKLYGMIDEYVKENSGVAVSQMKRLGASADWKRFKFTLDDDVVDYVLSTFIKMESEGLIYRAETPVNYCTKCGTSYSELEVNYQDEVGKFYYIKYPLVKPFKNKKGKMVENIVVATTRPETMFGDIAVAVHPDDKRYEGMSGIEVRIPLIKKEIKIIESKRVDIETGTGALKITPAHDHNDWLIREESLPKGEKMRYDRDYPVVINNLGKMTDLAPKELVGMNIVQAREKTVELLEKNNFFDREAKEHPHRVGHCYKCNRAIEILPSSQFFVKVDGLVKPVLKSLNDGDLKIHGAGRSKILRNWLENLKDWNVSRQIVWGIRMPVWYDVKGHEGRVSVSFVDKNGKQYSGVLNQLKEFTFEEIKEGLQQLSIPIYIADGNNIPLVVGKNEPEEEGKWLQETSTFDTWFSSSQWPVATLKTSEKEDLEYYYPTQVMETAYDILIFWVMRMLMMGIYLTGELPFKEVYLHGLIRDSKGQKMSKSKGNTINPLDMMEKYGTDALRMALVMSSTPGQDKSVNESTIKGMRNFANKIWNAARFIEMQKEEEKKGGNEKEEKIFKDKLEEVEKTITRQMDELRIGLAAETVYNEFWHWFCDECIEKGKEGKISIELIYEGLIVFLKLLHPFMPFVTERVWQELGQEGLLIKQAWVDEKK